MTHVKSRRLNVLHVATINKPIASENGYGPIETVIFNIDKGLHALGHRSIVACSADSAVIGEKFATVALSLGDYWRERAPGGKARVDLHLSQALARAQRGDIDVIHMHEWFERVHGGGFNTSVPIVMTLHVPGQHSGITELRARHPGALSGPFVNFVAISEYQRRQYAGLVPVSKTVLHGVDVDQYPFEEKPHGYPYLFHIGRITEVKGQDNAIAVAKRSGARLILAGCVQNKPEDAAFFARLTESIDLFADVSRQSVNEDYYDEVMRPILSSDKQIIYIGEVDSAAKKHWYRHALATLFPVRWGEPFGIVLIESMASGTPVLAFGEGAVPEIVKHGRTGFIVDSIESMVPAVGRIDRLDRRTCRTHVEANFSLEKMARGYADLYAQLADGPAFSVEHAGQQLGYDGAYAPARPIGA